MSISEVPWQQLVSDARSASGSTLESFARGLGVRPSLLGAIERGQLLPDELLAAKLREALGAGLNCQGGSLTH